MISPRTTKVLIIGGGAMGRALFDGWAKSGWPKDKIAIIDQSPDRCVGDGGALLRETSDPILMVIAVKPQHVATALQDNAHRLRAGDCVLSIAAGIDLATLRGLVPTDIGVFRAMPNLPVRVGKGTICLCHQEGVQPDAVRAVEDTLSRLGVCIVLEESHIDAFTAMAGSGPAYFYAFVEHLAEAGQAAGLSADVSRNLAVHVFLGAAGLMDHSGQAPADLREMVTSPAGTTAAGLEELNRNNALAALIVNCLTAAKTRSEELSATARS